MSLKSDQLVILFSVYTYSFNVGCKSVAYKRPTYQKPSRGRHDDSYKAVDGILYGSSSNTRSAKKTMWRVKLPGLHLVKEVTIQGTGRLALAPTFFLLNQVSMNFQLLIKTKMLKHTY